MIIATIKILMIAVIINSNNNNKPPPFGIVKKIPPNTLTKI